MTFGLFKKAKHAAQSVLDPQQATHNKAQHIQPSQAHEDEKDAQTRQDALAEGEALRVQDPTTGAEVEIRDAHGEPEDASKGENVLDIPYPDPNWDEYRETVIRIAAHQLFILTALSAFSVLTLYLPLPHLLPFSFPLIRPLLVLALNTSVAYGSYNHIRNRVRDEYKRRLWHAERKRGHSAGIDVDGDGTVDQSERIRESAEWANAFVAGVWPIINTDLFAAVTDMLEDIMQQSSPGFVESVRITDLGLGTNPLRITSIRELPDEPGSESAVGNLSGNEREQIDGAHVNFEVCFAYRARPTGKDIKSKVVNPHLVVEFFTGVKGVWSTPIPVWVELKGVVGTARARMQLISDPPFMKTTVITLMGLPKVDISVVAVNKALPNVMNLPIISGFIQKSIETAAAAYVAPKSLTLDLQQLISGDDMQKDTDTIGVLIIHIHRASGLSINAGAPDSYASITFSKLGAPLFATRVVRGERAPVFEETGAVLVRAGAASLREKVCVQLWDADRTSADDVLGVVQVDLLQLMRNGGKVTRRCEELAPPKGKSEGKSRGSVEFTVGFFGKRPPNEELRTDGADPGLPREEALRADLARAETRATALNKLEDAVLHCPPDPAWPCGVVSVYVHGLTDLVAGRSGKLDEEKEGETDEQGEGLPSAYCTISLNDELVYKTRAKPLTSEPMFNAGTERFVRDWRTAHVTVAVKDSRQREHDPILGLVVLKLSDLLENASQITRMYPIQEGVGTGLVRVSLLFRTLEARLPDHLRGFESGVLHVHSIKSDTALVADCGVLLEGTKIPSTSLSRKLGDTHAGQITTWEPDDPVILPLRERYRAVLLLAFRDTSGLRKQVKAVAALWLRDLIDNDARTIDLALWHARGDTDDYDALRRNYLPPTGDARAAGWDDGQLRSLERVGTVRVDVVFKPGLAEAHRGLFMESADPEKKGSWDEVRRAQRAGMRDHLGVQTGAAVTRKNAVRAGGSPTDALSPVTRSGSVETGTSSNRAVENMSRGGTRSTVGSSVRAVENGEDGRAVGYGGGLGRHGTVKSIARTDGTRGTQSSGSTADTYTSNQAVENARHGADVTRSGSALESIHEGRVTRAPTTLSGHASSFDTDMSRRAVENARHRAAHDGQPGSPLRPQSAAPTWMSGWTEDTDNSRRAVENGGSTGPSSAGHTGSVSTGASNRAVENGPITQRPYMDSPAMSGEGPFRPPLRSPEGVVSGDTVNSTDAVEDDGDIEAHDYALNDRAPEHHDSLGAQTGHEAEISGTTYVNTNDGVESFNDRDDAGSSGSGSSGTESGHRRGLLKKMKDWKEHQRELAQEHRGVMQAKPMRTAEWIKDKTEEGAHAVKGRFKNKERGPSVETEA